MRGRQISPIVVGKKRVQPIIDACGSGLSEENIHRVDNLDASTAS